MEKDRHYYYNQLASNKQLLLDKVWLKEALKCSLEKHIDWNVSPDNLEIIINSKFSKQDYLDFISLKHGLVAEELRKLEGIE